MLFNFDSLNRYEKPVLTLANPNFDEIGVIRNPKALSITPKFTETSELTFEAYENVAWYEDILKYRLIKAEGFGWFVITEVSEDNDGYVKHKSITCESYEYTLGRKAANLDAGTYKLYDAVSSTNTILGKMVTQCPKWAIGHISTALMDKYRTFEMPEDSVYAFLMEEASEAFECIFIFDCANFTINAYTADDLVRDSGVVLRFSSLLKKVTIDNADDDIVTELQCYGADDFSIANVNPLGTASIYKFDYFKDKMSAALWTKVDAWQKALAAAIADQSATGYAGLLASIKSYNSDILTLKAGQAEVESYNDSGEQVRTAISSYSLTSSASAAVKNIKTALANIDGSTLVKRILAVNAYPPINFASTTLSADWPEIASYIGIINAAESGNDLAAAQATVNISACEICSSYIDELIANKQTDIATKKNALATITSGLSMSTYFTDAERLELSYYVHTSRYENDYIVKLESYDFGQIQDLAYELWNSAKPELERLSQPAYKFDVEMTNMMFDARYSDYISRIETAGLGCRVHVETEDGIWYSPILLQFTVEYDSPDSFKVEFGSNYRSEISENLFTELFQESSKTSDTVSSTIHSALYPTRSGQFDAFQDFMTGTLNATVNKIINNTNQDMTIDQFGLLGKKWDDTTSSYSAEQLRLVNNCLVFTDDGWDTCKAAFGKLTLTDGSSVYGLIADVIIGKLLCGDSLSLQNDDYDSTKKFKFDSNGAELTNATFTLTSSDGKKKILLDPDNGIKIQGRSDTTASFDDKLYMDSNGNIVMSGNISATSGTIGSWNIGSTGLWSGGSESSPTLYFGTSPKSVSIGGTTVSAILKAGSRFGVTSSGMVYADGMTISDGTFGGELDAATGTFNQIISTGYDPFIKFGSNIDIEEDYIKIGNITLENNLITLGSSTLTPSEINLVVNSTTRASIDSSGMHVYDSSGSETVLMDSSGLWIEGATNSVRFYMNPPTASGGSEARWVSQGGYYSLGILSSSRKVKKDIVAINDVGNIIDKGEPVYFRYKTDNETVNRSVGFIAEDMDLICPEVVSYNPDKEPIGIQYSNITALLWAEIKSLRKRIAILEGDLK